MDRSHDCLRSIHWSQRQPLILLGSHHMHRLELNLLGEGELFYFCLLSAHDCEIGSRWRWNVDAIAGDALPSWELVDVALDPIWIYELMHKQRKSLDLDAGYTVRSFLRHLLPVIPCWLHLPSWILDFGWCILDCIFDCMLWSWFDGWWYQIPTPIPRKALPRCVCLVSRVSKLSLDIDTFLLQSSLNKYDFDFRR